MWNARIFAVVIADDANARSFAHARSLAREGKQMCCNEGDGVVKIIGCVASRVVLLLVHKDCKGKVMRIVEG